MRSLLARRTVGRLPRAFSDARRSAATGNSSTSAPLTRGSAAIRAIEADSETLSSSLLQSTGVAGEQASQQISSASNAFDSQGGSKDWVEPTLQDLDRSIPQVDCKFVADLIRTRNARRREFLDQKSKIKEKIRGWITSRNLDQESQSVEDSLVAELSPDEQEVVLHTRPEYDDGFILIDCRTVNEITSWGIIEGAKVLPAHEMFEAFHMTPHDFQESFGFAKPHPEQTIIFYCQFGPRSLMAAQILSWMGYENVLHFRDGYHEWAKQFNLLVRKFMEHDKKSGNNVRRLVAFEAARQLQREIAPEFNALPLAEAEKYLIDETRSSGTLKVGERVRENALKKLAGIVVDAPETALPSGRVVENHIPIEGGSSSSEVYGTMDALKGVMEAASGKSPDSKSDGVDVVTHAQRTLSPEWMTGAREDVLRER